MEDRLFVDIACKVSLTCDEDNVRSYHVAERCGFVREGLLRNEIRKDGGRMVGKVCYSVLKQEFVSERTR